jgi:hypothetical protein
MAANAGQELAGNKKAPLKDIFNIWTAAGTMWKCRRWQHSYVSVVFFTGVQNKGIKKKRNKGG